MYPSAVSLQPLVRREGLLARVAEIATFFVEISFVRVQVSQFVKLLTAMFTGEVVSRVIVIHVADQVYEVSR